LPPCCHHAVSMRRLDRSREEASMATANPSKKQKR
jgi:hypothetical protein